MERYIKENKASPSSGKRAVKVSQEPLHSKAGTHICLNLRSLSPDRQPSLPIPQQQEPVAQFFRLSLNSDPESSSFFQLIRKIPVSTDPRADKRAAPEELQTIWSDSSLNTEATADAFRSRLDNSKRIQESLRRTIVEHEDIVLEGHGTYDGQISDDVHKVNSMESYFPAMLAELICSLLTINRFTTKHPWRGRVILLGCSTGNLIQETATAVAQKMGFPIIMLGSTNTVYVCATDSDIPIYRTFYRDNDPAFSQDSKLAACWMDTLMMGVELINTFKDKAITESCANIDINWIPKSTIPSLREKLNEIIKQFQTFNVRMAGWPIFSCESQTFRTSFWAQSIYTRLKGLYLIISTPDGLYKPSEYSPKSEKDTAETLNQIYALAKYILPKMSTPIDYTTGAGLSTYEADPDPARSKSSVKPPPADTLPPPSILLPDANAAYDSNLEKLLNDLLKTPLYCDASNLAEQLNSTLIYTPPMPPQPDTEKDGAVLNRSNDIDSDDFIDFDSDDS